MDTNTDLERSMPFVGIASADRRCFPRFKVALVGICSVKLGPDIPCTTIDISVAGIALTTTAEARVDDKVIVILPEIGMAKGRVAWTFEGGFGLALTTVAPLRSRLAGYLVWLVQSAESEIDEARVHDRIVPLNRLLTIERADGRTNVGRVVNVSRSGIAFTSTATFVIGERILLGRHPGSIVHTFETGCAAQFDTVLEAGTFNAMISLSESH